MSPSARAPLSLKTNVTARARGAQSLAATQATALITGADADVVQQIPLEAVVANDQQPRRHFDQDALNELAASIAAHGLLQPVLVRRLALGQFELIAGERRWRASRLAGRDSIRAIVLDGVDDVRALEYALLENTARQDLTPIEEARGFAALIDELSVSKEAVAQRIGKSRAYVSNAVRLLDLPDDVLDLIDQRRLTARHGRELLRVGDQQERRVLGRRAAEQDLTVRALAALIDRAATPPSTGRAATASADHLAFSAKLADAITASIGAEVTVRPKASGFTLHLADVADAHALAARLGISAAALEP